MAKYDLDQLHGAWGAGYKTGLVEKNEKQIGDEMKALFAERINEASKEMIEKQRRLKNKAHALKRMGRKSESEQFFHEYLLKQNILKATTKIIKELEKT